jgi:hypothetical protein
MGAAGSVDDEPQDRTVPAQESEDSVITDEASRRATHSFETSGVTV